MATPPTEVTVKVNDIKELFAEHQFDPFTDDVETIASITRMAQLPHLVSKLKGVKLRVLVPASSLTPATEPEVRRALERYCTHMVLETRQKLAAMRWVGLRTFLVGWVFFGISLAAAAAVTKLLWVPGGIRELATESLIVAGWVVIWQPLDTLVQGWWPQWNEERTFRAIGMLPLRVEGY